ncbi:hypothetical protein EYF80_041909 [Liparis tanakae]|uniref:Uncharacterized protein n=1 Tax=Liparis tanakae TaxID=230148 RepID=A0A4Z2G318_9TELE|nr:hypothetical protein EYF80_041909 [Liparis tanakae]
MCSYDALKESSVAVPLPSAQKRSESGAAAGTEEEGFQPPVAPSTNLQFELRSLNRPFLIMNEARILVSGRDSSSPHAIITNAFAPRCRRSRPSGLRWAPVPSSPFDDESQQQ